VSEDKKTESSSASGAGGFSLPIGQEEQIIKSFIKGKVREIVRKKNGKYILYGPNKGKKKRASKVGEFPTKALAKQAELNRFPPRDPEKLAKARKNVDSMLKRKRKVESKIFNSLLEAAEEALDDNEEDTAIDQPDDQDASLDADTQGMQQPDDGIQQEPDAVAPAVLKPSHDDKNQDIPPSKWDELLGSIPKDVLKRDSRLRSLRQRIENQSIKALEKSVKRLSSAISYKVSRGDVGHDKLDRPYITCTIQTDNGKVGPIFMFVKEGLLHVVSDGKVKSDIMKLAPEEAKEINSALRDLPSSFDEAKIEQAIEGRDEYLSGIEDSIDDFLSDLNGLEMRILKRLLVDKYSSEEV